MGACSQGVTDPVQRPAALLVKVASSARPPEVLSYKLTTVLESPFSVKATAGAEAAGTDRAGGSGVNTTEMAGPGRLVPFCDCTAPIGWRRRTGRLRARKARWSRRDHPAGDAVVIKGHGQSRNGRAADLDGRGGGW